VKRFAALYAELDASTSTLDKVQALQRYLGEAPPGDAAWAVYFLAGGRPRQVVRTAVLRALATEMAGLSEWLFEASYQAVGDLAETIAHVLPPGDERDEASLTEWVERRLLPLKGLAEPEVREQVRAQWQRLDPLRRMLWVKLAGGGFRVGISRLLVQRALSAHAGVAPALMAQRMVGYTDARTWPTPGRYAALVSPEANTARAPDDGRPYPFFLAHALTAGAALDTVLGPVANWLVEWKYDGIRAQLVRRGGQAWLWSRGEELVSQSFPEVIERAQALPEEVVLDGELLAWLDGRPAPFALLQQRLGRKRVPARTLAQVPVVFMAYDLLEQAGQDLRPCPQHERRRRLKALLDGGPFAVSPALDAADWPALAARRLTAREQGVEGLMLKRLDSAYGVGRTRSQGLWWKWKTDPLAVDGVLIYAQAGHGRRASLYTDYTFAVWNRAPASAEEAQAVVEAIASGQAPAASDAPLSEQPLQLVAFAKAYSGLSDEEFRQIDAVIRRSTLQKFGPVRSLRPTLVFELGFEGISPSRRHKSGVALRFPRMLRIRSDKPLHEAGTLAELRQLLGP
jgi:DNA ligase-1